MNGRARERLQNAQGYLEMFIHENVREPGRADVVLAQEEKRDGIAQPGAAAHVPARRRKKKRLIGNAAKKLAGKKKTLVVGGS